jgi:protein involved in polysaccharide export with SLBB domain
MAVLQNRQIMTLMSCLFMLGACQTTMSHGDQSAGSQIQNEVILETTLEEVETTDLDNEPVLMSGQILNVIVMGEKELSGDYLVSSNGQITFPFIGQLNVLGKTSSQVKETIITELKNGYLNNPFVKVRLKDSSSNNFEG